MLPNYGVTPTPRRRPSGSSTSRTGRRAAGAEDRRPTGPGTSGITSTGRSPTTARRCTASRSTPDGQPLDTFGRNLYVDTLDSVYGAGWKRENSFLTHTGTGAFCYSVNPHGAHPSGKGTAYRATIIGPGVTPDVMWQGAAPRAYDKATRTARERRRSRACTTRSAARTESAAASYELGSLAPCRSAAQRRAAALFRRWPAGRLGRRRRARRPAGRADGLLARLALARAGARRHLDRARRRRSTRCCDEAGEWGVVDPRRRPGPSRPALRAQRAADRALGRHRRARGRPAPDRGRGRLDRRAHGRRARGGRPHALRRRGRSLELGHGSELARPPRPAVQRRCDRAVVFDLDGVLIDSEQVWDEVREQLAHERGGRWTERRSAT